MSTTSKQVRFEMPSGTTTIGQVVSEIATADPVSGPETLLVVDVDGSQFRVAESDTEAI